MTPAVPLTPAMNRNTTQPYNSVVMPIAMVDSTATNKQHW